MCDTNIPEKAEACPSCGLERLIIELEDFEDPADNYDEMLDDLLGDDDDLLMKMEGKLSALDDEPVPVKRAPVKVEEPLEFPDDDDVDIFQETMEDALLDEDMDEDDLSEHTSTLLSVLLHIGEEDEEEPDHLDRKDSFFLKDTVLNKRKYDYLDEELGLDELLEEQEQLERAREEPEIIPELKEEPEIIPEPKKEPEVIPELKEEPEVIPEPKKKPEIIPEPKEKTLVRKPDPVPSEVRKGDSISMEPIPELVALEEEILTHEEREELMEMMEAIVTRSKEIRGRSIKTDMVERLLEQVNKELDNGKVKTAYRIGQEAVELCDALDRFYEKSMDIKEDLKLFKKRGWEYRNYVEDLRDAKSSIEAGLTTKGIKLVDSLSKKIDQKKRGEKLVLEKKGEINEIVSHLNNILTSAASLNLPLREEREMISNALMASKTGDVQKAYEWLVRSRDISIEKIEDHISHEIKLLEERTQDVHGRSGQAYERMLMDARDAKIEEDYTKAAVIIQRVREMLDGKLKEEYKEIETMNRLISAAESLGVDCTICNNYFQSAMDEPDPNRKRIFLKNAKMDLQKRLPSVLQGEMKEGLKKLAEAKKQEQDITKAVSYLKQANLFVKKRDFLRALLIIDLLNEHLETIRTKDEVEEEEQRVSVKKAETRSRPTTVKKTERRDTLSTVRRPVRDGGETSVIRREEMTRNLPRDLRYSCSYLIAEKKPEESYTLFKRKLKQGMRGICITRQYPLKVKSAHGLEDVRILWLSNIDQKDAYKPKNLEKLSLEIEKFLSAGKGLILMDGIEYLISNNDFRTVLHLIQSIKDQVSVSESILIISAAPRTLEKHQLDLLEKEVDETYML